MDERAARREISSSVARGNRPNRRSAALPKGVITTRRWRRSIMRLMVRATSIWVELLRSRCKTAVLPSAVYIRLPGSFSVKET